MPAILEGRVMDGLQDEAKQVDEGTAQQTQGCLR